MNTFPTYGESTEFVSPAIQEAEHSQYSLRHLCPLNNFTVDRIHSNFTTNDQVLCHVSGLEQSMKLMIGKSIDPSMTIDALLVNWHRPIDNHTKVVEIHRSSSIGVKISPYPTHSKTYVYSFCSTHKCLRFEFIHQLIDWH